MKILAIDPGSEKSAAVLFDGESVLETLNADNADVRLILQSWEYDCCAIEHPTGWSRPGRAMVPQVLTMLREIGRFQQVIEDSKKEIPVTFIYPQTIRTYLCHSARADDKAVATVLKALFGENLKQWRVKNSHLRSALAVAVTTYDQRHPETSSQRWGNLHG